MLNHTRPSSPQRGFHIDMQLRYLSWLIVAPDGCSNRAARRWQHPLVGLVGMLNRDPAMRAVTL
jgi:hypothetical protein